MPKPRSPNRDKAYEIWKEHNGQITNRKIADMLDEKENTVSNWKSRDKWNSGNVVLQTNECSTTNKKRKKDAPKKEVIEKLDDADLTEKQRLFCLYYVKSFNGTLAAIKAGYSKDTSYQIAYENLRKPEIISEIKRLKGTIQQEIFIDAMDVLQKYITIAFADITDYLTFGKKEVLVNSVPKMVNYVDFNESNMIDGSIISEVKQGKDGVSIKLEDRMKALDKLSLYFDLFPDKFKRQIEEEKLKLAQQRAELDQEDANIAEDWKDALYKVAERRRRMKANENEGG